MGKKKDENPSEEEKDMATFTSSNESVMIIDKNKVKEFLEDAKKNTISPEFLKRCLKFSKMLNKGK